MKILVSGGAGYIGSVTSALLIKSGHEIVVFDNLNTGHKESISPKAKFIQGDIKYFEEIKAALKGIDAVVHFAALSLVGESCSDPRKYFDNNTVGTLTLLNAMSDAGVKLMVFSSSAAVYGSPKAIPITEEAEKCPENPYGETKLMIEKMIKWYSKAYGLAGASLRYFNAAGADLENDLGEDHRNETHLIPLVLKAALGKRKSIAVYGTDYPTKDGTCVRDYIHIKDLANAHVLALEKITSTKQTCAYNLGSENGFTVREIIETAKEVTGINIPSEDSPRRAGDPAVLVASSQKIQKELGWKPKHSAIKDLISDAWSWHKKHPDGY